MNYKIFGIVGVKDQKIYRDFSNPEVTPGIIGVAYFTHVLGLSWAFIYINGEAYWIDDMTYYFISDGNDFYYITLMHMHSDHPFAIVVDGDDRNYGVVIKSYTVNLTSLQMATMREAILNYVKNDQAR